MKREKNLKGMSLHTKCILHHKEDKDGIRVSVMSRHTLSDGMTPDPRITRKSFDLWLQELAPSPTLIGDYYKRGLPWEEFEQRYKALLSESMKTIAVRALAEHAMIRDITLLCIEDTPEQCHRRLLAEQCKIYEPKLNVIYK